MARPTARDPGDSGWIGIHGAPRQRALGRAVGGCGIAACGSGRSASAADAGRRRRHPVLPGLMACSRSLRRGRLPLWNDLWGFGFPGSARARWGSLPAPPGPLRATSHRACLRGKPGAAHALGGPGGVVGGAAVRGLGGRVGAGGFSFVGVRVLRDPPAAPWGYTTGSWMPWAWGLAWSLLERSERVRVGRLLRPQLAIVFSPPRPLPARLLHPGRLAVLVAWWACRVVVRRRAEGRWPAVAGGFSVDSGTRRYRGRPGVRLSPRRHAALADGPAGPARGASATSITSRLRRDAAPPRQLRRPRALPSVAALAAPGLGHRSTPRPRSTWRTSGLVPLFLASGRSSADSGATRRARPGGAGGGDAAPQPRPYVPGFRHLIALPGFSFFRAPARWGWRPPGAGDPGGPGVGRLRDGEAGRSARGARDPGGPLGRARRGAGRDWALEWSFGGAGPRSSGLFEPAFQIGRGPATRTSVRWRRWRDGRPTTPGSPRAGTRRGGIRPEIPGASSIAG